MGEGRRYFFFGITVSEIAFILFFVLLLFTFIEVRNLQKEQKSAQEQYDRLQASSEKANKALQAINEVFGDISGIDLDDPLTILTEAAEAIQKDEEKEELISSLQAENETLKEENREATRQNLSTTEENKNLKGQVANLQQRAGVGLPPCWVTDESGEIEYLFRITLFGDESVNVVRDAPDRRQEDYFALPSVPEITDRKLVMPEFERLSRPIYDVGMGSEPECRHFVKVRFADRESCRLLLITERYFYKIVEANESTICTG